ncbi:MAG: SDR family oxidoreductase, partial [Candidatus Electrothrix sp. AR3]|nr:SDR family oxidoreductase [Candidatus Electrothrix sp. AR3]
SYLLDNNAWKLEQLPATAVAFERNKVAELRHAVSKKANRPMILQVTGSQQGLGFAQHVDVEQISQQGPVTPDHVSRTKAMPMIGRNLGAYKQDYCKYFKTHELDAKDRKTTLDPAPRVILDRELGLCCVGKTVDEATIVADIYEHSMRCILRAEQLGGWRSLPLSDLFAVEYWDLEQAKLRKGTETAIFNGEVALVTGAASGIGRACVESFLSRGAAVVGLDIDPRIIEMSMTSRYLGLQCDITDETQVSEALDQTVRRFGGLDMLVLNAGIFPESKEVAALSVDQWRKVMQVNLDANLILLRETHPLLRVAPDKGRVVVIGSKNVPAPGPGAAAYSTSKAALTQLIRVVALEWGKDGVRINILHPNAVFDTGIWTDTILQARAEQYGLTAQEYKTNNLLSVEVTSKEVSELAVEMCGPLFSCTTAAQVPIDGGNDRVI